MLPQLEQQPLFNAINFNMNMWNAPNFTVHGVGISTLWCPSDPGCSEPRTLPDGCDVDPGAVTMSTPATPAMQGTWMLWYQQEFPPQQFMNGLFHIRSAVTLAQITDGTSNTIAFSERAHTLLDDDSATVVALVDVGQLRRHAVLHAVPHEPVPEGQRPRYVDSGDARADAYHQQRSSLHPGGANFAFMDGSVRFLKDTINTWPATRTDRPSARGDLRSEWPLHVDWHDRPVRASTRPSRPATAAR